MLQNKLKFNGTTPEFVITVTARQCIKVGNSIVRASDTDGNFDVWFDSALKHGDISNMCKAAIYMQLQFFMFIHNIRHGQSKVHRPEKYKNTHACIYYR